MIPHIASFFFAFSLLFLRLLQRHYLRDNGVREEIRALACKSKGSIVLQYHRLFFGEEPHIDEISS